MRYMGIDFGAKRIGIAVSDESGTMAFPRTVIENDGTAAERIAAEAVASQVHRIVVGDTMSYGGIRNPVTTEAEAFIERIKTLTMLPVERAFEAGSSIEASRYAPEGKGHNDSAAAAVILQRFLDMKPKK